MGDLVQTTHLAEPIALTISIVVSSDYHGAFLSEFEEFGNFARP
tara:strand:- start:402 stop:533 length:132 start_codon:yes stop_codon:yes gene_type:complete